MEAKGHGNTTYISIPALFNLRFFSIAAELLADTWNASQLLPSGLKSLDMLSPTLDSFHTQSSGTWLRNLHQRCYHLRALSLNLHPAPASGVDLQLLLLLHLQTISLRLSPVATTGFDLELLH